MHPAPSEIGLPSPGLVADARYVAIDFETANASRASPCAIGLAWMTECQVIATAHRLIRPTSLDFDLMNISIHGIRPEHVVDCLEFPDVWCDIVPLISGKMVVCHNAAFDISVLRATLDFYGLEWPELPYLCTVKVATEVWPDLTDHRLPTIAEFLRISLDHHNAASDALVSGTILLRSIGAAGASDVDDMLSRIGVTHGRLFPGGYHPCSSPSAKAQPEAMAAVRATAPRLTGGKEFVFTGALSSMERSQAFALVEVAGGVVNKGVRRSTDYLVVGDYPSPSKIDKAKKNGVVIIDEVNFLKMIGLG